MVSVKSLSSSALGMVVLSTTTLVGIAIVTQMKNNSLIDNTSADAFVAGLTIFATFSTLVAIVLIGSAVIKLVKGGMAN